LLRRIIIFLVISTINSALVLADGEPRTLKGYSNHQLLEPVPLTEDTLAEIEADPDWGYIYVVQPTTATAETFQHQLVSYFSKIQSGKLIKVITTDNLMVILVSSVLSLDEVHTLQHEMQGIKHTPYTYVRRWNQSFVATLERAIEKIGHWQSCVRLIN